MRLNACAAAPKASFPPRTLAGYGAIRQLGRLAQPEQRAALHRTGGRVGPASRRRARRALLTASHMPGDARGDVTDLGFTLGQPSSEAACVKEYDFVVVGSGIAGLSFALKAAEFGSVAVVTKASVDEGCTRYAQGGVCAVLDAFDSVDAHIRDTLVAGAYLNDPKAVEVVCREGPARVLELAAMGACFTTNADGSLHLTREGGHSAKRIVHAADLTGAEIERALVAATRSCANIDMYEHHLGVDLIVDEVAGQRCCLGLDVLDTRSRQMMRFVAPATMLATGGAGQVYPVTTNPTVTTGDGIAMAYRAKAAVANMEFVQFHPTSLYTNAAPTDGRAFLITEALRGEGGRLYNQAGERFMTQYDDRLELATRDIVSRAIHDQLTAHGDDHVLLDISHARAEEVLAHFPNVAARCAAEGIDITRDPIPVVPAQHYFCGGVRTGLAGDTSLAGLYGCGEVASSGLHGANRLASNSLLEGLVFANRALAPAAAHGAAVRKVGAGALRLAAAAGPARPYGALTPAAAEWVAAMRAELRRTMWAAAGIVRSRAGMKDAFWRLATMYVEARALRESVGVSPELQELFNLVTVGELVVSSALQRKESRGGHYCVEYPAAREEQRREVVIATSLKRRADLGAAAARGSAMLGAVRAPRSERAREMSVRSSKAE